MTVSPAEMGSSASDFASTGAVAHNQASPATLPDLVDSSLLRGAPASVVFEGLGRHWRSSKGSAETYAMSKEVDEIDDFLSHSWQMAGWQKLLSLCFLMNSLPAFLASSFAAILAGLLQCKAVGLLPLSPQAHVHDHFGGLEISYLYGWWPLGCGAAAFLLFFLFWQQLREAACCGREHFVFVDKVCIHQTDKDKKAAAVAGLAGILRRSKRLVILLSPEYFSRLFCVYEVASWIHLGKAEGSATAVLPSRFVVGMLLYGLIRVLCNVLAVTVDDRFSDYTGLFSIVAMSLLASTFALLQKQLAHFDISQTKCFCCTEGHKDPETGEEILCHRKMIYATLEEWFPYEAAEFCRLDNHLDKFNDQIRKRWGQKVLRSLSNHLLIYQMGLAVSVPHLWDLCCRFDALRVLSKGDGVLFLCHNFFEATVLLPSVLWLSVWMSSWASTLELGSGAARAAALSVGMLIPVGLLACHEFALAALPPGPPTYAFHGVVFGVAAAAFGSSFLTCKSRPLQANPPTDEHGDEGLICL